MKGYIQVTWISVLHFSITFIMLGIMESIFKLDVWSYESFLITISAQIVPVGIIAFFTFKGKPGQIFLPFEQKKVTFSIIFEVLFVPIALFILSETLFLVLNWNRTVTGRYSYKEVIVLAFSALIVAPIMEEILTKKIILQKLLNSKKGISGILYCSVLFGIMHFGSIDRVIGAFLFSLFSCFLYLKYKKVYICSVFHFVTNFCIYLCVILMNRFNVGIQLTGVRYQFSYLYVIVSIFILGIFLYRYIFVEQNLKNIVND